VGGDGGRSRSCAAVMGRVVGGRGVGSTGRGGTKSHDGGGVQRGRRRWGNRHRISTSDDISPRGTWEDPEKTS
jgi:hypothetical protein